MTVVFWSFPEYVRVDLARVALVVSLVLAVSFAGSALAGAEGAPAVPVQTVQHQEVYAGAERTDALPISSSDASAAHLDGDHGPWGTAEVRTREAFGVARTTGDLLGEASSLAEEGKLRAGYPVGDVDADGRADVLLVEYDPWEHIADFFVVQGDGAVLWTRSLDVAVTYLMMVFPGDLDGDGGDDVVFFSFRDGSVGDGICLYPVPCVEGRIRSDRWTVEALRGSSGEGLFDLSYTTDGSESGFRGSIATYDRWYVTRIENETLSLAPAGDLDGDGGVDLVVASTHIEETTVDSRSFLHGIESASVRYDADVEVVGGADGRRLGGWAVRDVLREPFVLVLPDITGDLVGDVVVVTTRGDDGSSCAVVVVVHRCWEEGTGEAESRRTALFSLLDWHEHWSVAAGLWASDVGDLDGDGLHDLRILGAGAAFYSGATGTLLWSPTANIGSAHGIGDVEGDGLGDLLFTYKSHTRTWASVEVRRGFDGMVLYGRTFSIPEDSDLLIRPLDDLDADGIRDISLMRFERVFGPSGLELLSGANGTTFWAESYDGWTLIEGTTDLDADGDEDVIITSRRDGSNGTEWAVTGRDEHAATVFEHTLDLAGNSDVWSSVAGGSLDNDGSGDVVVAAMQYASGRLLSRVSGLDGASGDVLFSRGSDLLHADGTSS